MARKKPTPITIKRLYALSGNQCAFPDCTVELVSAENETNISNVCHIEAAELGGERYNSDSTDDKRRSFENLILLCPNHHTETNNVEKYTAEVLRKMKKEHEDKIRRLLSEQNILLKNPSALNIVIKYIGTKIFDNNPSEPQNAPDLQEKILYNNISRYKSIIEEYAVYQGKLNKLYEEIENQGSPKKELVLQNIKTFYLLEKGSKTIEEIRANADNIIDKVKDKIWEKIDISDLYSEAIELSIIIILVDAFMRCNILEEPPKYDSQ